MKIKGILLILSVFLSVSTFGQKSDIAKKILDDAAQKIKDAGGLEATFKMTINNAQGTMDESSDGIILLKDKKYKLNLLNTESYYNGETLWTYMKEDKEVNISEPDEEDEDSMTPNNIFSMYKKGFTLNYVGEIKALGKSYYSIDMYPQMKNATYTKVNVLISKSTQLFTSFHSYGRDGINSLIQIKNLDLKKQLNDSVFIFDPTVHVGVDIIDLR